MHKIRLKMLSHIDTSKDAVTHRHKQIHWGSEWGTSKYSGDLNGAQVHYSDSGTKKSIKMHAIGLLVKL